jgi:hypothetical protein
MSAGAVRVQASMAGVEMAEAMWVAAKAVMTEVGAAQVKAEDESAAVERVVEGKALVLKGVVVKEVPMEVGAMGAAMGAELRAVVMEAAERVAAAMAAVAKVVVVTGKDEKEAEVMAVHTAVAAMVVVAMVAEVKAEDVRAVEVRAVAARAVAMAAAEAVTERVVRVEVVLVAAMAAAEMVVVVMAAAAVEVAVLEVAAVVVAALVVQTEVADTADGMVAVVKEADVVAEGKVVAKVVGSPAAVEVVVE